MLADNVTTFRTLLALPGELQNKILDNLAPLDLLLLRSTCLHFRAIIPPLDIHDLLVAESSNTGRQRDLYACSLCLRLRHSSHFADSMKKLSWGKFGTGGSKRFCLDCGVDSPGGKAYDPESFVIWNDVVYVVCLRCRKLENAVLDEEVPNWPYCAGCWSRAPET